MAEQDTLIENRSANEDFLVFLDLVIGLLSSEKLIIDFVYMSGYDLGDMDKPNTEGVTTLDKVVEVTRSTRTVYESVREQWPTKWKSWNTVKASFKLLKQVFDEYKKCKAVFDLAGVENGIDIDKSELLLHVMQQVILRGHAILVPSSIQLYRLLNWVSVGNENEVNEPEKDTTGRIIRYPYRGLQFNKDGLDAFFRDPVAALKEHYFGNNNSGSLLRVAGPIPPDDKLLIRLRDLLLSLDLNAFYGYRHTDAIALTEEKIQEFSQTLTTWFPIGKNVELALSLRRQDQNIIVAPQIFYLDDDNRTDKNFNRKVGKWEWTFNLSGGLDSFSFGPDGVALPPGVSGNILVDIAAFRKGINESDDDKEENPAYVIGTEDGTRLELGKIDLRALLDISNQSKKADIKGSVTQSGFYLLPGDGDSFLKKVLPEKGIAVLFDLAVGYSNERGFYLEGGGGGEIVIPLNKKVSKFSLPSLQLGFRKITDANQWMLYASIAGRAELGPVNIELDKVGMRLLLKSPPKDEVGNLGIFDADFDFKPPNGVGIEINAKVVTGGGYLYIDEEKGEYFGVAQLNIKNKINVKALGIIQTKLPGGQPGYSFLLIISAEFPAIQLGLGFSLTGVGGLIGIHRRIELQKIQEGIQKNDIDDILFPKDPLKNVYAILTKINQFFPAADGQYTFGLMAQLAWGPKSIITIELGLILEFPEPVRLALIGVIRAEITRKVSGKEIKALQLQVNFVAAIDFDKKFISLDAALFQSKLLGMKLEGDMALRIKYGDNPDFAITIGGFHPRFQPPALQLPTKMRRLQIILRSGNPSITVSCYLAVTSNTIQFGVAGLFVFKKWGVGIRGELSFDALFQLSPFRFETDLHFLLAASWKGYDFASIEVNGTFSGPSPWHIEGSLKLKAWIFSKTVSLNETWGEEDEPRLEKVRILPLLADDLSNDANWERATGKTYMSVTLRKHLKKSTDSDMLTLHPNELLSVRQTTVPLDVRIDKFSGRQPQGANTFRLALKNSTDGEIPAGKVKNHFASAQFIEMSEERQLSTPSYELFDSGLTFEGLDAVMFDDEVTIQPFTYETKTLGEETTAPLPDVKGLETIRSFAHSLRNSTLANSAIAQMPKAKPVALQTIGEKYVIAEQGTLKATEMPAVTSAALAWQLLDEIKQKNPQKALSVLPLVEAVP
jgi:hypothetical protein